MPGGKDEQAMIDVQRMQPGEAVHAPFLVMEKNLASSQKGSPYLALRLRNQTGVIEGRVWDRAEEWSRLFRQGDVIRVRGRAVQYRNVLQLSIHGIERLAPEEVVPGDYLPRSAQDTETMFAELLSWIEKVQTPCLRDLLRSVFLDDGVAARFRVAPAAKGFHHDYLGGLLEHTLAVTRLLEDAANRYPAADRDLLLAGGLLHDLGKIQEFTYDGVFDYTNQGRLVGHIVLGVELVDAHVAALPGFPEQAAMELRHLILSHHGLLEYGSPKRPKTLEALMVHHMDDLDAKINAFQKSFTEMRDETADWTPYHRLFGRYLYRRPEPAGGASDGLDGGGGLPGDVVGDADNPGDLGGDAVP